MLDELVTSHTTANSLGADIAAIMAKTNNIGTGTIAVTSPVKTGNGLEIIRGDDYLTSNSRVLTWTDTGSTWATLVGSTITLVIGGTSFTGTVVDADNLKVELTAAQTTALTESTNATPKYVYYIRSTNGSGKVTTLVRGLVSIKDPADS